MEPAGQRPLGAAAAYAGVSGDIRFAAETPTAANYAERRVLELHPDAVVLPVASFGFTAGFAWVRVRSLFGERAGRWFKGIEVRLDRETRNRGRIGAWTNIALRKSVRTVIGTQPLSTREEVTASYREILRTLSRVESLPVVLVTYPGRGAHAQSAKAKAARRKFFADVRQSAEAHHFAWVSGEDAFDERAQRETVHGPDRLHFNEAGHRVLGEAVAQAISEALGERQAADTTDTPASADI